MKLTKYEQETIISFNAGEKDAEMYTRDKAVIRQMDALAKRFPDLYKQTGKTDLDKTYSFPKSCVSYRKPRKISEAKREQAREQMKMINKNDK
jgi:hypothetical protein